MSSKTRFIIMPITRFFSSYDISRILSTNSELLKHQSLVATNGLGNLYLSNDTRSMHDRNMRTRNFSSQSSVQQSAPLPSQPPSSSLGWIFGIILTTALPLVQFKSDVDTVVETIEEIVEVVENVAEVVDKVADGVSSNLPEGGKMKKAVDIVGNVAEGTAKVAHTTGDAIDELQNVEGKVENIVQTLTNNHTLKNQG